MEFKADFLEKLGYSDFDSWILVQKAYRKNCWKEDIMECGFNQNSGYVYIALENGISICSCFGREVEYLVIDFDSGEESFFEDYEEALESI